MEPILRALGMYLILLVVLRLSGKRSLAQITIFDFVLLLVIGDTAQQALLGEDYSLTQSALVIMTLVLLDVGMSLIKQRSKSFDRMLDSAPLVIVQDGKPIDERMQQARVDENDVLSKAREFHGLERLEQIKYAVLERSGQITIIPEEKKS